MANVDFAKGFLWASIALVLGGVGFHFYLEHRLKTADTDNQRALDWLKEISVAKENVNVLASEKDNDEYLKRDASGRLDEFLAELAQNAGMDRGPSKEKPSDDTPTKANGYKDTSNEISWLGDRGKKQRFTRQQLAHFCWSIENRTNLLKVTQITMTTNKEELDDLWEPRITITERKPVTLEAQ